MESITKQWHEEAKKYLRENWDNAESVISAISKREPLNVVFKDFLTNCTPCGGDWGSMLLSGINKVAPEVYAAIPDDMGCFAFSCIVQTLILMGVDCS